MSAFFDGKRNETETIRFIIFCLCIAEGRGKLVQRVAKWE